MENYIGWKHTEVCSKLVKAGERSSVDYTNINFLILLLYSGYSVSLHGGRQVRVNRTSMYISLQLPGYL